ncbi:hypothetical protein AB4212_21400, partial [Streptomyces sp. 2MCAF27]
MAQPNVPEREIGRGHIHDEVRLNPFYERKRRLAGNDQTWQRRTRLMMCSQTLVVRDREGSRRVAVECRVGCRTRWGITR